MALEQLFSPKSIALIGTSREAGKLGNDILSNLLKYKGKIFPVNPKAKKILGKRCYARVGDIPAKIDLAIIVVPALITPQILEECGKKGIKTAVIISAGFKEIGKVGAQLEQRIIEIAKKYNIQFLGPNCLGVINTDLKLNASFAPGMPSPGNLSIISQSGALAVAFLDWTKINNFGFNKLISLGNKAILSENDALSYLEKDKNTRVIAMYLESIPYGEKFIKIAQRVVKTKPIIVLKAGITEKAKAAVAFHTGSMTSSDDTINAAFEKAGIIRACTFEELLDLTRAFSYQPLPNGNKLAIITNAGGPGVLAVDALKNLEINLADLFSESKKFLKNNLPVAASINNPIDIIGDAKADRYKVALETVFADKNVDMLVCILTPQTMTEVEKTAKIIVQTSKKYKQKPILCAFLGGEKVAPGIKILHQAKISNYDSPERAVWTISQIWKYKKTKDQKPKIKTHDIFLIKQEIKNEILKILDQAFKAKEKVILGERAEKILKLYGFPVEESILTRNLEEGKKIAAKIGYPVVLKISSPKIIKKTDIKGVKVGIKDEAEFAVAFNEILENAKDSGVLMQDISGILVQKMIFGGREFILGMRRDASFGPLLIFGLGGIYTEVLRDISFGLAPLTHDEAEKMIFRIRARKFLEGIRGEAQADTEKIIDSVLRLSQLSLDFPKISYLTINPLLVFEKGGGVKIVDARILLN